MIAAIHSSPSSSPASLFLVAVFGIGILATLFKPLPWSIVATFILGLILSYFNGRFFGSPLDDFINLYFAGMLIGLAVRLSFLLLGVVSRVFITSGLLPPEVPWIIIFAVLLFLGVRTERHRLPSQRSSSVGIVVQAAYTKIVSYL